MHSVQRGESWSNSKQSCNNQGPGGVRGPPHWSSLTRNGQETPQSQHGTQVL